ncbi:MAG: transketolase [Candidatus Magasanikbacteria bacterium]|jgi:transketolase|nr:transketolase [Candidatus Magasanikbacteria bacterium]
MQFKPLTKKRVEGIHAFAKDCRHTIISMLRQSQSGHPGGSAGCIDYLSLLYTQIISRTGEKVVVSNGHISPAVYAVLAQLGYVKKQEVIDSFRHIGSQFEGHVTRHVPGVDFGTGPLGAGVSAAAGFALAEKLRNSKKHVFALIGDGESQEGQVYEMMNFAAKYKLDNFIVFMDYNSVQLSGSLKSIMPISPAKLWEAAGWKVIEVDGHNITAMWRALSRAYRQNGKPILLLAKTIMGKGIKGMEKEGRLKRATWHGNAPKPEVADTMLESLTLSGQERKALSSVGKGRWKPEDPVFLPLGTPMPKVKTGQRKTYSADTLTDCRSAYGNALLDLAKRNANVIALTADVADSVKTSGVKEHYPERHIDVGVAEQHMVSCSGGLSLHGMLPFCSTFGAFMTSRAKDQARVNDLNQANVKMVATHCGLSVGEDGPTHQAIDDMGSMLGLFNTMVMEPADPNQCDAMVRYSASHYGNVYMRMGRHKIPVLTSAQGKPLFGKDYTYTYGDCHVLRKGTDVTIAASGPMVIEALQAWESLKKTSPKLSVELVIMTSPKKFGNALLNSIKKTKQLITVEDHNTHSGYASQIARMLQDKGVSVKKHIALGVDHYQLSGTAADLYDAAGISAKHIAKQVKTITK